MAPIRGWGAEIRSAEIGDGNWLLEGFARSQCESIGAGGFVLGKHACPGFIERRTLAPNVSLTSTPDWQTFPISKWLPRSRTERGLFLAVLRHRGDAPISSLSAVERTSVGWYSTARMISKDHHLPAGNYGDSALNGINCTAFGN
jgi:hypothetical protein